MTTPGATPQGAADLVTQEGRVAFIKEVLSLEAEKSTKTHGTPDYSDDVIRLATVLSHVIGPRQGAYKDLPNQHKMADRLIDISTGFIAGTNIDQQFNPSHMINNWVNALMEKINGNFQNS